MFTIMLLIVAFVVVGILAGARAGEQHRQIGLLKAVGFTPRQVGVVFALESAALGGVAAVLGFALGVVLAPRLAEPSAETLLGRRQSRRTPGTFSWRGVSSFRSSSPGRSTATRRSTRFTVVEAIGAGSSTPSDSHLAHAVTRSRLPLTIRLGLKDTLARGRRALLLAAAVAVTGAVVVAALSLDATLDARPSSMPSDFPHELLVLVYTLVGVLLLITATTLAAVALLSVRERVRDYGILKAIGVTPGQIVSTVVGANLAVAVLASLAALPLGIGLYLGLYAMSGDGTDGAVIAPWWALALIPVGAVAFVLAATSLPAWLATRIRTSDALRYE